MFNMKSIPAGAMLASLVMLLSSSGNPPAAAAESLPHIVVILVDDMGYGDFGCLNPQSKIATPHIDRLAEAGMRFTDAHAPGPLCHMSRYGLLTGRYPFRTDVSLWPEKPLIEQGETTVASLLKSQGYRTAMVGKWHLGFEENGYDRPLPGGPVDVGFDTFFGIRASTDIPPYFYIRGDRAVEPPTATIEASASDGWSPIQGAFWRGGGIAPGLQLQDVLPRFTEEAIEVITDHAEQNRRRKSTQPLMLYLAYPAPHTPWLPAEEYRGRSGAGMYGEFAMMVDAMIGRVLETLDQKGMAEETLVLLTSDNGPTWYPQDVARFQHDSAGGFRGMKADAWEAGHRLPLIVRWPGVVQPGSMAEQTVSMVDLLATFADITDAPLAEAAAPDSFSFLPVLLGQQPPDRPIRESLVLASGNGTMTIRSGDWKLIAGLGSGGFSKPSRIPPIEGGPAGQLYNLAQDPGESENLYARHPDVVQRLTEQMEQIQRLGRSR